MNNEVFNAIVDSSRTAIENTPEWRKWNAKWERLQGKVDEKAPELSKEFFMTVWEGIHLYHEAQFMNGWRLRGNPDALFELPEPE